MLVSVCVTWAEHWRSCDNKFEEFYIDKTGSYTCSVADPEEEIDEH